MHYRKVSTLHRIHLKFTQCHIYPIKKKLICFSWRVGPRCVLGNMLSNKPLKERSRTTRQTHPTAVGDRAGPASAHCHACSRLGWPQRLPQNAGSGTSSPEPAAGALPEPGCTCSCPPSPQLHLLSCASLRESPTLYQPNEPISG